MRGIHWAIIGVYLAVGVYLVNLTFKFLQFPQQLSQFDNWIILAAGVLLIIGAYSHFRGHNYSQRMAYRR